VFRIDAESRETLVELAMILVWCLWAMMISWFCPLGAARTFDPTDHFGTLCVAAGAFIAAIALARGERVGDKRLNRWDEAVALCGTDCLLDIVTMV
jgi:hypothetical protein